MYLCIYESMYLWCICGNVNMGMYIFISMYLSMYMYMYMYMYIHMYMYMYMYIHMYMYMYMYMYIYMYMYMYMYMCVYMHISLFSICIWCPICTYAGRPKTACEIKQEGMNYDQPVDLGVYCFQTNPDTCIAGSRTRLCNGFGPWTWEELLTCPKLQPPKLWISRNTSFNSPVLTSYSGYLYAKCLFDREDKKQSKIK